MKTLSLALALATPIQAALRFGCATLTVQRLDPVVEPGTVGTSHLHHIIGGNAFNATMEGDIGEKGTCTTCTFSEDFSNYWTAVLYLKAANGYLNNLSLMYHHPANTFALKELQARANLSEYSASQWHQRWHDSVSVPRPNAPKPKNRDLLVRAGTIRSATSKATATSRSPRSSR